MKRKKRAIPPLRKGASEQEIVRWTSKHDVFDRLDTDISEVVEDHSDLDRVLREALFEDNTAQLNMRIPPAMKGGIGSGLAA